MHLNPNDRSDAGLPRAQSSRPPHVPRREIVIRRDPHAPHLWIAKRGVDDLAPGELYGLGATTAEAYDDLRAQEDTADEPRLNVAQVPCVVCGAGAYELHDGRVHDAMWWLRGRQAAEMAALLLDEAERSQR